MRTLADGKNQTCKSLAGRGIFQHIYCPERQTHPCTGAQEGAHLKLQQGHRVSQHSAGYFCFWRRRRCLEDYTHTELCHGGRGRRKQLLHAHHFTQCGCYIGITGLFSQERKWLVYMNKQARGFSSWLPHLGWAVWAW